MRLLIAVVVWAAALAGAVGVSNVVADSIHNKPRTTTSAPGGGIGASAGGNTFSSGPDPSKIKATQSRSLFATANFPRALATVRAHVGADAKVDNFALYPGYLDLTIVKGGSETDVYVAATGSYMATDTGGDPGADSLFSLAHVQATAPGALARRIATAAHLPESQLGYMVAQVDPVTNQFRWLVYPVSHTRVEYFEGQGAGGPLYEYRTNSSTGLQRVGG